MELAGSRCLLTGPAALRLLLKGEGLAGVTELTLAQVAWAEVSGGEGGGHAHQWGGMGWLLLARRASRGGICTLVLTGPQGSHVNSCLGCQEGAQ